MKSKVHPNEERIEVLIVDDSRTQAAQLRHLLEQHRYRVTAAEDGKQALALLGEHMPAVVITDIVMPEVGGFELCQRIKAEERTQDIPVILLTSLTNAEDVLEGLASGADSFITKPYSEDYLLTNLQQILANRELRKSERVRIGVEIYLAGHKRFITADQQQMLTLLISTYEAAVHRNGELIQAQDDLSALNAHLEDLVEERTAALREEVAERKRAEESLILFRSLVEQSNDAVEVVDTETGRFLDVNEKACTALGYSREELLSLTVPDIDPMVGKSMFLKSIEELRKSGAMTMESAHHRKDGTTFPVEISLQYVQLDRDYLVSIVRDITERKGAEEALALHTRRVQALLDLQLLSHAREDEVLDFVLDACLSMTQSKYSFVGTMDEAESVMTIHRWSKEAMAGCALSEKPIEYPISAAGLWADCVRERRPVICNDYAAPHPNKKGLPDGHVPIHRFLAVPIVDGDRIVAVAAAANKTRDYTEEDVNALSTLLSKMWEILSRQRRERERELLEEQLHQAQKMESIGQLAGGVAHDFNNILQAILGYGQMLLDRLPEKDESHEFCTEIVQGAERAAGLTRQLLAFSRRQVLEMEDLSLNEVVENVAKMVKRVIGENIQLRFVPGHRLGTIHADRGQMEQVILNLCVNARDAMPDGGVLTTETENVVFDDDYCATHAWAVAGQYVLLSITDTGSGMDAETQTRIFEPFFTTKELGKGTGLGLATVYGIVRQHQGMIQVYSEPGKGTTFKVYLPIVERAASKIGRKFKTRPIGGSETILLAEDDEGVRNLTIQILKNAGYTVLPAVNGREAIDVFRRNVANIDLVLADVVMPELGGKGVYEALIKDEPNLRFLFLSGYSANAVHTGFVLHEHVDLIQKPFAPADLLCKVREVLDRTQTETRHP